MLTCAAPMTIGNSGATLKMLTWGASSSCSPHCLWTKLRKLEALGGAELNEAKKVLANAATALLHGEQCSG